LPDHVPQAAQETQGKRTKSIEISILMNIGHTLR
jgi:hypothetical protein